MNISIKTILTPADLQLFSGIEQYYRTYTILLADGAKYGTARILDDNQSFTNCRQQTENWITHYPVEL
jgi:hypothetical protein